MPAVGFELWPRRGAAAIDLAPPALPPGVTLTRGSTGTRVTAQGVLASEPADTPRFDHHPATLAYAGLLVEEARTNQLPVSGDLSLSAWSRTGTAAGNPTAVIETNANGLHHTRTVGGIATSAGIPITVSLIAGERAGSAKRYLSVGLSPSNASFGGVAIGAVFDLATGTFVAFGPVSVGMSVRAAGRWLCWWSATPVATASSDFLFVRLIDPANAGSLTASYVGDNASGIEVGNLQVEAGPTPSTRITTTGAAATRAADVVRIEAARLGGGDGTLPVRIGFDDGSEQRLTLTVAGGLATLPTPLARSGVRRIERG